MLHRFRLAGALALLVGLTGCAEYGYVQRSSYPSPGRAPTYDNGGDYDRVPSRTADRRVEQDAADYAQFVDRNLHLTERQEYAIRDILEDRAYRALDRREAYPFPRRDGYARGFWRDADSRIERVLDRYQRDYYRHLTGRGERYYREVYYYDYCYIHYDRFPTRWRTRYNRDYYRTRSRSYRNDRGRADTRNGRADQDGNRGRVQGQANHDRNRTVGTAPTRNVNNRREQTQREERQRVERQRTERQQQTQRAERQRTERQQQAQRAERQRQEAQAERQRTERQRTEQRREQRTDRREQRTEQPSRQRTERPSRQRTESGSRSRSNGRSPRGRTSRGDG